MQTVLTNLEEYIIHVFGRGSSSIRHVDIMAIVDPLAKRFPKVQQDGPLYCIDVRRAGHSI